MAKVKPKPPLSLPYLIIGSVEWVALPELGINRIRARVDTGAKTSALCTANQEVFKKKRKKWVRFSLHIGSPKPTKAKVCEAPLKGTRIVRSPAGEPEQRLVIESTLHLGWEKWIIELTLTDRRQMSHRMLLGRSAMQDRVLVNPSHTYLHGQPVGSKTRLGVKTL